jgi:hypothetical protein
MQLNSLETEALKWFTRECSNAAFNAQCTSVYVLHRQHTGLGLVVSLAFDREVPQVPYGWAVPNAPLIKSLLLPHGGSVDLWVKGGMIYEIEFVALGGAAFPTEEFPFDLVASL